ncbi:uncharacterized protein LOC115878580 [Sitophilus oryzae]|uniref:Uncharacterized protein LOC115878580 n=1 Tax=Sitophilus oryzae TaxID=7048 RepID=A0A6J2XI59_SITOR|nr:uncharacterized protein LOC115878580 [Sitophilus oryzae]
MHQPPVEIIVEELKSETQKEFDRITNEAINFSEEIHNEVKDRINVILDLLKCDIVALLQTEIDEHSIEKIEIFYKDVTKNIYSTEMDAWKFLKDKEVEHKNQLKKSYEYACEILNKKDKSLEKIYKTSKTFLKSNLKERNRIIKDLSKKAQELVVSICKNAKKVI